MLWWALAIAIMLGAYSEWVYPHPYFRYGVDAGSFGSLISGFLNFFFHAWRFPLGFGSGPLTPFTREVWFTLLVSLVLVAPAIYGGARMARWKNPPGWRTSIKLALFIPLSFLTVLFSLGVPMMAAVLESEGDEPEFYAVELEFAWSMGERFFSPRKAELDRYGPYRPETDPFFFGLSPESVSLLHPDGRQALVLVHLRSPSPLVRHRQYGRFAGLLPSRLPQAAVFTPGNSRFYLAEETPALLRAFPAARKAWEGGKTDVQGILALLPPGHPYPAITDTNGSAP